MADPTTLNMARDEHGHGCFAIDLDGEIHGFVASVRDALITRGVLYQDADTLWRLRWHGFDLQRESATWMAICDFCSARPVAWNIPCATFEMPPLSLGDLTAPPATSNGDWAACDTCGTLIAAGKRAKLLGHCQRAEPRELAHFPPELVAQLRPAFNRVKAAVHARFWAHYRGGAVRIAISTYGH